MISENCLNGFCFMTIHKDKIIQNKHKFVNSDSFSRIPCQIEFILKYNKPSMKE